MAGTCQPGWQEHATRYRIVTKVVLHVSRVKSSKSGIVGNRLPRHGRPNTKLDSGEGVFTETTCHGGFPGFRLFPAVRKRKEEHTMAVTEIHRPNPSLMTRAGRDKMREEIRAAIEAPKQAVIIALIALAVASLAIIGLIVMAARHAS